MNSPLKIGPIALLAVLAGSASSALGVMSYPNFNSVGGLTFKGVASQTTGLGAEPKTISVTPPAGNSAGAVWANAMQNVAGGFITDFDFRIRDKMGLGADGLAFVIQNDPRGLNAIGGRGGGIGFGTNMWFPSDPGPGIKNSIAVVFDTWDNTGDWSSIPGTNIITVQMAPNPLLANQPTSAYSIGNTQASGSFSDGSIHHVRISYVPLLGTGQLQVYYDNNSTPALTVQVGLDTQLLLNNGAAFVGFTGATGGVQNSERHEVLNWTLTQAPAPSGACLLALGGMAAARRRRPV